MSDKKERVKALCKNFEEADKIIQDVKSVTKKEVIPAISQLRYAGWHLARWLNLYLEGKEGEDIEREFSEVTEHSKRALFDAARHGILFCMNGITDFRNMYAGEILPEIIAGYSEKMHKAEESRKFLISVSNEKREIRAEVCYQHFLTIRDIFQELICCQPELNKLRDKKQNEIEMKQKEIEILKKRHRQLVIISIISILVTIAIAIIACH